jgi:transporter family-2 protein
LLVALSVQAGVSGVRADRWPPEPWLYVGGLIGTVFIAVAALVVATLGVLRFGLASTAGQLVGAMVLDVDRGIATTTAAATGLTFLAVAVSGRAAR